MRNITRGLGALVLGAGIGLGMFGANYSDAFFHEVKSIHQYKEGDPNTLTYIEWGVKKTICDLNGRWKATYNRGERIVAIQQKNNNMSGVLESEGSLLRKGEVILKAQLDRDTISGEFKTDEISWNYFSGPVAIDCSSFEGSFMYGGRHYIYRYKKF